MAEECDGEKVQILYKRHRSTFKPKKGKSKSKKWKITFMAQISTYLLTNPPPPKTPPKKQHDYSSSEKTLGAYAASIADPCNFLIDCSKHLIYHLLHRQFMLVVIISVQQKAPTETLLLLVHGECLYFDWSFPVSAEDCAEAQVCISRIH